MVVIQLTTSKGRNEMLKINQNSKEKEATKNKIPQMGVRTNINCGDCSAW